MTMSLSHHVRSAAVVLACLICTSVLEPLPSQGAEQTARSSSEVAGRLESGDSTVRIVCFGDSITGVYYHTGSRRAWCDMLGLALQKAYPKAKVEMINAGISGHTTVNALSRIEKDVIARKPDLVVVMFGMNDVARVKLEAFQENLRTIVGRCLNAGSAVVLCTPNSVYENPTRPNARLQELSQRVRQVASERKLSVVDCYESWQELRRKGETEWALIMSDDIHPNMNGHKRFAELVAGTISGKDVSLGNVDPPADALDTTFNRLKSRQPVKLIAIPPYDKLLPDVLRLHFPEAQFEITAWPVEGESVAELREWAKHIRGMAPHLVVVAVPGSATDETTDAYIRNYEWVLNWSFHFGRREWDVLPILPTVTGPVLESEREHLTLARQIVIGKDVQHIDRRVDDARLTKEILTEWVSAQAKRWKATKSTR